MRKILTLLLAMAFLSLLSLPQAVRGGPGPVLLPPEVLRGLENHVEVVTDPFGVPHIYAQNTHDLYFVTGYIEARDRLFQMDVTRRQASGTLAELLGQGALESDVTLRTLGLRRAAELSQAALSPEALAELQAFADGVNTYIAEAQGMLPPEYRAWEVSKVEPWTVTDSLVIGKAIAFQLSFDLDVENTLKLLAYQGAFGGLVAMTLFHEDLFRSAPANPASAVPDALGSAARLRGPELAATLSGPQGFDPEGYLAVLGPALKLARDYYNRVKNLDFFQPILHRKEAGSNWFLLSGRNTTSGYPLIANDPHLALTNPAIFYEIHQVVPGELNVYGVTFAGIPTVIQGQNPRIAWGSTMNPMDVTDTFKEKIVQQKGKLYTYFRGRLEPVQVIPEVFKMNVVGDSQFDDVVPVPASAGVPQATLIVPRHGPIINLDLASGTALSVQFTGFYATHELETFRLWNRARNLDEFKEGLKYFDFGSQNWAYADVDGNIAYFTSGELPLREDLEAGTVDGAMPPWLIRDGTGTYKHQWIPEPSRPADQATPCKILPFSEMPQIVNPPLGFVVNSNNDPIGNTLDNNPLNQLRPSGGIFYLNYSYDFGFRAGRLTELIRGALAGGDRKVSLSEAERFQGDVVQLEGRRLVPYILQAYETAGERGAPRALARFTQVPRIQWAIDFLRGWSYNTPTGIPEGFDYDDTASSLAAPSQAEVRDSVATTI
ncbi:MAG: penicillin acylase family protein, partial [Candidatus Bipolaricaulia bacterium]